MTNSNNNPYEEFDVMLKKVQWPTPGLTLESRILAATTAPAPFDGEGDESLSPWVEKNPLLSFFSVLLALFIGLGSGALTGSASHADSLQTSQNLYGIETQSINHLYFQNNTN